MIQKMVSHTTSHMEDNKRGGLGLYNKASNNRVVCQKAKMNYS
jgi:hypothetical protein